MKNTFKRYKNVLINIDLFKKEFFYKNFQNSLTIKLKNLNNYR